jgi:hypothetical protein
VGFITGIFELDPLDAHFYTGSIISQHTFCGHFVQYLGNSTLLNSRSKNLYPSSPTETLADLAWRAFRATASDETLQTPVDDHRLSHQ